MAVITPSLALWGDKKEWTKEELVSQLKPMCMLPFLYGKVILMTPLNLFFPTHTVFSEDEPDANNEIEISVSLKSVIPLLRLYVKMSKIIRNFKLLRLLKRLLAS